MEQNFEQFFQENQARIHYQIQRLGISGPLYEELYSEGMFALWLAYKDFDSAKGEIGTYINYKIRFRLLDFLRKKLREEDYLEKTMQEKITFIEEGNRYGTNKYPLINNKGLPLSNEPFWEEVRKPLSDRQWKWVKYFIIAELTLQEIAELENTSIDAVKSWGREARRKLREQKTLNKLLDLYEER